jgi:hypothetical protein
MKNRRGATVGNFVKRRPVPVLAVLAALLFLSSCVPVARPVEVPDYDKPGVQKAMREAALGRARNLGYELVSEKDGKLTFSKMVAGEFVHRDIYYIRVTFGRFEQLGGGQGFRVECWTLQSVFNPQVSGHCVGMQMAIARAAGLKGGGR